MANVTLRIDDSLLAEARRLALDRDTTVNRMIREFLATETKATEREETRQKKIDELFEALDDCDIRKRVPALNREELYDR